MSNDEITDHLELTARLMELHQENPFKTRAYTNAAFKLSKLRYDFSGKSQEEIAAIEGVGKSISGSIYELMTSGTTSELKRLLDNTPPGVVDMLGVKGLGPKKVRQLWLDLHVESVGELLYACNENRLVTLKGFGEKTQAQVKQNIEFRLANANKFHYAALETAVYTLKDSLIRLNPGIQAAVTGQMARKCEVIDQLELLIAGVSGPDELKVPPSTLPLPVHYSFCETSEFYYRSVELSSSSAHLEKTGFAGLDKKDFSSEEEVYQHLGLPFIAPELREGLGETELARSGKLPRLIEPGDLKGVLHNHSTYSDGVHSLKEMADYCQSLGYAYFGICDHSRTAVYANGLSIERVLQQQEEIDRLNEGYTGFRILKGIESDILNDGSLDYPEEVLKTFDFVVASVHSNLKMTEEKATERLIRAIENPYTSILGHPTGRLLLARNGYPVNHKKIIEACAANKVSIELNAHPYRLDIDWRWIPYCLEKGVMISINPDAHHKEGFHDMYYGVCVARKGLLDKAGCLNALSLDELNLKFRK